MITTEHVPDRNAGDMPERMEDEGMKYNIKYACGHEGTVDLFGKNKEREKRIWYLEQCDRPECQAKAEKEKADKLAAEYGLPQLTGTPKQVAWAEKLRNERVNEIIDAGIKADDLGVQWVFRHEKASYWIDTRELSLRMFIREAKAQIEAERAEADPVKQKADEEYYDY